MRFHLKLGVAVLIALFVSAKPSLAQPQTIRPESQLHLPQQSTPQTETVKIPTALQAPVARMKDWRMHGDLYQVDQEPTVRVSGTKGYRIVFRRHWKEPPPGHAAQQRFDARDMTRYIDRHTDTHFVLVPIENTKLSAEAKREILWHIADEKEYRVPVALGEGHGFAWFSYCSIPAQHFFREQIGLVNGEDELPLLIRGLSIDDEGTNTRNSVFGLFSKFGDRGYAALNDLIDNGVGHRDETRMNAILALGSFRDERTTGRLMQLYFDSSYPNRQKNAAYALISRPIRPSAKAAYFDMLKTEARQSEAIEICVAQNWTDAAPLIGAIVERPLSIHRYVQAYPAYRQLSGKPIDPQFVSALEFIHRHPTNSRERTLPSSEQLTAARRTLVESKDVEAAIYVGLLLESQTSKGGLPAINQEGIDLLKALPRPAVEVVFNRLLNGAPEESYDRNYTIPKLIERVNGIAPQKAQTLLQPGPFAPTVPSQLR